MEVVFQAVFVAVHDAAGQPLVYRQAAAVFLRGGGGFAVGEQLQQLRQRVAVGIGVVATIPDQVSAGCQCFVFYAMERQDAARMDYRRIQPGLKALLQKHRVEHMAGRRVQTE